MNDSICMREKEHEIVLDSSVGASISYEEPCGKQKNPEHLYCPECEVEVYDTLPESREFQSGMAGRSS